MGFSIVHRPDSKMQAAVIDQHIGWYGSINLIGRLLPYTTVIRMTSSEFAIILLDAIEIK